MGYVSFDIEIAKADLKKGESWEPYFSEMGITCAATLCIPGNRMMAWKPIEKDPEVPFRPKMDQDELIVMAQYLVSQAERGNPPLAWNGARFDFRVLMEEAPEMKWDIIALSWDQIDPALQMMTDLGYATSLKAAAAGMGVEGKLEGMTGAEAPIAWTEGRERQDLVLEYVKQDVAAAHNVYQAILEKGELRWTSGSGRPMRWKPEIGDGRLLTVAGCLQVPQKRNPLMSREEAVAWMK